MNENWDYLTLKIDVGNEHDVIAKLKKAGLNGWELVQILFDPEQSLQLAIFKQLIDE